MAYGPRSPVDGPVPAAPRYNLVQTATLVDRPDERWANGIAARMYECVLPTTWERCLSAGTSPAITKPSYASTPLDDFDPFEVVVANGCTAAGTTPEDLRTRIATILAATEAWGVEREFWVGDLLPDNPHLDDGNADILGGGEVAATEGLALLEGAIADSGRQGMIHAPAELVTYWTTLGGVARFGQYLETHLGTRVVPGAGYPGTGDDEVAAAAGTSWAYATGPVQIIRSAPFIVPDNIAEALDRRTNDVEFRAERVYGIVWDTCVHAGVLVNRTGEGA